MGLGEEFDLADAAAPALQVEPGAGLARAGVIGADAFGQPADFLDRAEIEAAPPYEGANGGEEALAGGDVARRRPGADECGALPRDGGTFIMCQRGIERDRERAHLRRRTEAQVDAEHVTLGSLRGERLDHAPRDPLRSFARLIAFAAGQQRGIEEQDRIDVGAIVQLARTLLAERERGKAGGLGLGHAVADRIGNRCVERAVGKIAQLAHNPLERKSPREVPDPDGESERQPLAPQCGWDVRRAFSRALRPFERGFAVSRLEQRRQLRQAVERLGEKRRMRPRASDCLLPVAVHASSPALAWLRGQGGRLAVAVLLSLKNTIPP